MSIAELFPNAGSYTGSTRSALAEKVSGEVSAPLTNDLPAALSGQPTTKMPPIDIMQNLLTEDALSQVFDMVTSTNKNINSKPNGYDVSASEVEAAARAYAKVEDVRIYNQNSSVFLSG